MVALAIPFELVFTLYVLPLNLKVTCLPLSGVEPFFRVARKTSFLADFLTLAVFRVIFVFL